jgi:hypothetical protein
LYRDAILEQSRGIISDLATWKPDNLGYMQGYLQALVDIDPRNLTVEGFE